MSVLEEWMTPIDTSFMRRGNCVDMDTNLFFPYKGESQKQAIQTCLGRPPSKGLKAIDPCPVREECLNYALNLPATLVGVWGGTSQKERRRLRSETASPQPVRYKPWNTSSPSTLRPASL
jgi:WhiB family redox-sensing transcriptional regulator